MFVVVAAAVVPGTSMLSSVAVCRADTIERKDGKTIEGKYAGGTATAINLETPNGVLAVPIADIAALKFGDAAAAATTAPAAAAAAPAAAAVPAAAAPAGPVTIPAGTVLAIRMESEVTSKDPEGKKFTGKLLADLAAGAATVAKAGSTVYGQVDKSKQAGRLAGKSQLAISLSGIELAPGQTLPILTTNFAEASAKGEGRKTARNVAAGALIGNAVDDDGGGGKGAAVGAGVSLIRKGDSVTIPPGALLEFKLTQPVTVTPK
jgi:hypothetical protein